MRLGPEGAPFVPERCPVPQWNTVPDLRNTAFKLGVEDLGCTMTGVWGRFSIIDEEGRAERALETQVLILPAHHPRIPQLHQLPMIPDTETVPNSEVVRQFSWIEAHPFSTVLGNILRKRVAKCDGVVEVRSIEGHCGMQCWALGQVGLHHALNEAAEKYIPTV